jgi:hypothetical protein
MNQRDIFRSANELIKLHGDDAKIAAALQADACADDGNTAGAATWLRVIDAIEELQDTNPPASPRARH